MDFNFKKFEINNYRNFLNNLIIWEWKVLKHLRKKMRRNILLRASFAIFSLVSILICVFSPPFILGSLLIVVGVPHSIVGWSRIIGFFAWLWFISPMDKLSKKDREEKNKRKVEVVKAVENAIKAYDNKFK